MWSLLTAFTPGIDESAISNDTSAPSKPAPDGKRRAERHWWQGGPRKQNLRGKRDSKRSKAVYFERIWVRIARVRRESDQKRPRRSAEAEQQWIGMCLQSSETAEFGNLRCRYRLYRMLRAFGLFGVRHGRIGPPLPSCDLALPLPGCWPRLFAQVLSRTGRRGRGRDHHPEEPLPGLVGEELARLPRSVRGASPIPLTRIAHPTRPTTTRHECYHRTHSTPQESRVGRVDGEGYLHYSNSGTSRTAPASPRAGAARALYAASSGCPRDIPQAGASRDNRPSGRVHITFAGGDVFTGGGQWVSAKPRFHAALIDAVAGRPRITEVRNPVVLVSNEAEPMGPPAPAVPAAATVPVQHREPLPELPIA